MKEVQWLSLVQQSNRAKAGDDADRSIQLGKPDRLTPYKAARIYAQAVRCAQSDKDLSSRQRGEKKDLFAGNAIQFLRQTMGLTPANERRSFLETTLRKDEALDPVRRSDEFLKLESEFSGTTPAKR